MFINCMNLFVGLSFSSKCFPVFGWWLQHRRITSTIYRIRFWYSVLVLFCSFENDNSKERKNAYLLLRSLGLLSHYRYTSTVIVSTRQVLEFSIWIIDVPEYWIFLFPAFSALDFSMRSEQIDMIRDWLSPAKTSDANFRIECTVVRDLLDSEIDYVSALRLVVQVHFSVWSVSDLCR